MLQLQQQCVVIAVDVIGKQPYVVHLRVLRLKQNLSLEHPAQRSVRHAALVANCRYCVVAKVILPLERVAVGVRRNHIRREARQEYRRSARRQIRRRIERQYRVRVLPDTA